MEEDVSLLEMAKQSIPVVDGLLEMEKEYLLDSEVQINLQPNGLWEEEDESWW